MKLSITLVNYHSIPDLRSFLASFVDYRPDCRYEVIIVDNSRQKKELEELREEFGDWVRILSAGKNVGFGKAQNLAAKKAKGEYLFICNPDVEFQDESMEKLLHFAEKQPDFGIIGPRLLYPEGGVQESCRRFPSFFDLIIKRLGLSRFFPKRMRRYLMEDRRLEELTEVDWLVGAALLVKKDRFLEIGGFDDRFFLFFEDTDLCRRMKKAGYKVWFYPDAMFIHSSRRLSERGFWPFKKVFWVHLWSALRYFWKWRGNTNE